MQKATLVHLDSKQFFFSPRQTMTFVRPWTRYQTSSTYPEIILGEAEKDFNMGGGVHDDFEEVMRKGGERASVHFVANENGRRRVLVVVGSDSRDALHS